MYTSRLVVTVIERMAPLRRLDLALSGHQFHNCFEVMSREEIERVVLG
jgi:hypothetical protein